MDDNDITYIPAGPSADSSASPAAGTPAGSAAGTPAGFAAGSASDLETRVPYVRKAKPRKTQEAINDFESDDGFATEFTHDSNVTVRGRNPLSGTAYSRSRANMPQLQRDLHYGQYLEIPKGKRSIFSSRERSAAVRSRAITAAIVIALVIVGIIAWQLILASQ